jgi:hypothetical protein
MERAGRVRYRLGVLHVLLQVLHSARFIGAVGLLSVMIAAQMALVIAMGQFEGRARKPRRPT